MKRRRTEATYNAPYALFPGTKRTLVSGTTTVKVFNKDELFGFFPIYAALGKLGGGTYGDVYAVTDRRSGEPFALKLSKIVHVMKQSEKDFDKDDKTRVKEALREHQFYDKMTTMAPILADVFVRYYDAALVQDGTTWYMAFLEERMKGTLKQLWTTADEATKRMWERQAFRGLALMHDVRFIHRDIKYNNLMIDQTNRFRFGDLGIGCLYTSAKVYECMHLKKDHANYPASRTLDVFRLSDTFLEFHNQEPDPVRKSVRWLAKRQLILGYYNICFLQNALKEYWESKSRSKYIPDCDKNETLVRKSAKDIADALDEIHSTPNLVPV